MISVIVPVYNAEKYLHKCLDSILSQTYTDLEVILVNDGSTDTSGEICEQYKLLDHRIIVIHKENGGQATARNMALEIAKGDYIGFIDSDDYIAPEMYKTLLSSLEANGCDISICSRYHVDELSGKEYPIFCLDHQLVMDSKESLKRLCIYDCVDSSPCDKLFKRALFEEIRYPIGYICEDVDVVFRLLYKAQKIVHCGIPLYYYLQRKGSTSHSGFSEKTKGLVIYHKNVSNFVKEKHPEFSEEADYFFISRLLIIYDIIVSSKYKGHYKKEIERLIWQNKRVVQTNRYFNKREKQKVFLIKLKLYSLAKGTRKYIR